MWLRYYQVVVATLFSHFPMSTLLIKTLYWGISVAAAALWYRATYSFCGLVVGKTVHIKTLCGMT